MPSGFLFTFNAVNFDRAVEEMRNFLALEYFNLTKKKEIFEKFAEYFEFKKIIKNVILVKNLCKIDDVFLIYAKTKEHNFKRVHKIIPLEILISNNYMEKIMHFFEHKKMTGTFKIIFKKRFTDLDLKEDIFNFLSKKYSENQVNLTNPDNEIIIEVNKKVVGLSLIKK